MPTPWFQFKQFTVWHDQCAMKVGTDGVLLGAWATPIASPVNILDIGTGSGLVALMLAQRFPFAHITAIDIDEGAFRQADFNFKASPWSDRLQAVHSPMQDFRPNGHFDLIVSNPPFFSNSLKAPDKARNTARHNDTLELETLLSTAQKLVTKTGSIVLILPVTDQDKCVKLAERYHLFCTASTVVFPKPGASARRVLLAFSPVCAPEKTSELTLETAERGIYTPEFAALVRDFYLKL